MMAPAPPKIVRYYRDQRGNIARLGLISLVSAQFQAVALVLVVPLAQSIARGHDRYRGRLGPVRFDTTTGELALLAAGAIVVAAALDFWIAWARSKVMAAWELDRREQVIAEFLHADYPTQAGERLGTLGTLTAYVNRGSSALGAIVNGVEAALTILM